MRRFVLLTLILAASIHADGDSPPFPTFTPPKGWKLSDPSFFKDTTKIGFIQSSRNVFSPAITLSVESIGDTSPSEYVEAIKKIYLANPRNHYEELGFLESKAGKMRLIQLDEQTKFGTLRIFQATLIQDGYAIIQTASTLKTNYADTIDQILESFRSLTIHPNFYSALQRENDSTELQAKVNEMTTSLVGHSFQDPIFQKNHWKPFVEYFTKKFKKENSSWQILTINAIQEQLLTERTQ